ncbi:MAG: MFS transporter [Phycisphaeraceae bacterium]|nr:MAG: MFS transporter [Phycisphaeraceae bacterium]
MTDTPAKTGPVLTKLSVMMFLQFFVWGAWYVSMTGFINKSGMGDVTGAAYMVGPIAAIISPFFLGLIADRYFSSERVLGVLHLIGGLALIAAPFAAKSYSLPEAPENAGLFYHMVLHDLPAFGHPFILLLLVHMLCYMPTLGLTSSLAFHNLTNREKQFPLVRVLGTLGWIVGNIAISFLPGKDGSAAQFYLAGGAGIVLALFSFMLPHTPAPLAGEKPTLGQILGLDSLALFKNRSYAVFIICSFLICIPLAAYYQQARNFVESAGAVVNESATFTMSFGQMSEVIFMVLMPLFFARLGVKWMLAVGMLAWVVRYGLFAAAADDNIKWMVLGGVLLHGICYDFFFVTGMIYVDRDTPAKIRGQAQGFLVFVTQGLGMIIGAKVVFWLTGEYTNELGEKDWKMIWAIPAAFALAVLVLFMLLFKGRGTSSSPVGSGSGEPAPEPLAAAATPDTA